jgi:hypothetical protein
VALVRCKLGGEILEVPAGQDAHAALDANGCSHCVDNHGPDYKHGQAAPECPKTHPGPCWNPPDTPDRPEGCTVCRPVLFMGNVDVGLVNLNGTAGAGV